MKLIKQKNKEDPWAQSISLSLHGKTFYYPETRPSAFTTKCFTDSATIPQFYFSVHFQKKPPTMTKSKIVFQFSRQRIEYRISIVRVHKVWLVEPLSYFYICKSLSSPHFTKPLSRFIGGSLSLTLAWTFYCAATVDNNQLTSYSKSFETLNDLSPFSIE